MPNDDSAHKASRTNGCGVNRMEWLQGLALDHAHVTPNAQRLGSIIALKYINNGNGNAWPSQATLAADMGAQKRAVRDWIKELERAGWLVVKPGGGRKSSTYRLAIPARACLSGRHHGASLGGTAVPPNLSSEPTDCEPAEELPLSSTIDASTNSHTQVVGECDFAQAGTRGVKPCGASHSPTVCDDFLEWDQREAQFFRDNAKHPRLITLPADWFGERERQVAEVYLDALPVGRECVAQRFEHYWRAGGTRKSKAQWFEAWWRWCRKEVEMRERATTH